MVPPTDRAAAAAMEGSGDTVVVAAEVAANITKDPYDYFTI